jgi:chromosome segregation ATPase
MIFESVGEITNAKNLEDKYQVEIDQHKDLIDTLQRERADIEHEKNRIIKEKDLHRDDAREQLQARINLEKKMESYVKSSKEASLQAQQEIAVLREDAKVLVDDRTRYEKQVKALIAEREKMRQRIVKLKLRKGKVDYGIKMCKNCGKEFHEKDNFNWSCRLHRSEYGGELWWCCGKRGKE